MNKTTKALSVVTILLLFSKLVGFVREMIIAAYYGATYQTDAYNMAINIIGLSTAIISAGVATVIIPMYNHKRIQKSKNEADLFANNILWITSLFYVVLSVVGIVFAPVLVRIFAPSFEGEIAALTVNIIRMTFIFTVAINISNYMTSIAKIYDKFAITVIANFPLTIWTVIITIIFAKNIGIYALVISYVLFLLTQALILLLPMRKVFKFKTVLNFTNGDLLDVVKLSLPIYLNVAVGEINSIIDRMLASGLPEGSISAMNYSAKLRALPDGIITASVITVMFPLLSQYAAKKDFVNLKAAAIKAISLLSVALFPVVAVSVYYSGEITKIVYERGAFTSDTTVLTANIFIFAVPALIFSGSAAMLSNSFYSMQDTKTPQIAMVIMVACNITLNLLLVRSMQAAGLTLATTIAYCIYFIILFILFRRKCGAFGGLAFLKNIGKCVIATAGMIPVFLVCELLRGRLPLFIFFAVAAAVSLLVYALLLYLLKVELFMEALRRGKTFLKNRLGGKG